MIGRPDSVHHITFSSFANSNTGFNLPSNFKQRTGSVYYRLPALTCYGTAASHLLPVVVFFLRHVCQPSDSRRNDCFIVATHLRPPPPART